MSRRAAAGLLTCALLIAGLGVPGCAAGPAYHRPAVPRPPAYAPAPLPTATVAAADFAGSDAERFVIAADVDSHWWTAFGSPVLDTLVRLGFEHSPTIVAARAALQQAQELVAAQRGLFYPTINAGYSFERQKAAGNVANSIAPGVQGNGANIQAYQNPQQPPYNAPLFYNLQTAQLTVGYVPDVFGSNWRQLESLQAQAEAERCALEAAYLTLASNIVSAAVQEAAVREQIAAVQALIAQSERGLEIVQRQAREGYAMRADVAGQQAQLAQVQSLLPPLQKQLEQTLDLMRVLVGQTPDQDLAATFRFEDLHLPQELPISVPARLLEQRPDVRAAEAILHSANAQLGVAIAARLPQFSINGSIGGTATEFPQMFASGGPFWNLIYGVTQPVFAGGTLLHRQRAAREALIEAGAQYQATILTAYQNVADTLHAILGDAEALLAARNNEQAARVALEVAEQQRAVGQIDELLLLQAETGWQQAVLSRIQAQAQRFGDAAALYVALGGGWGTRSGAAP